MEEDNNVLPILNGKTVALVRYAKDEKHPSGYDYCHYQIVFEDGAILNIEGCFGECVDVSFESPAQSNGN